MAVVNNVIDDFFNLPRTDETRQNYVDFQAGKIDIFGNPKGTNLAESMANPGGMLSETNVEQQTTENNVSEAPSMLSENNQNIGNGGLTLKQQFSEHKDALKIMGFDYVNPKDLNFIYDEISKEFKKSGIQNVNDIGKRNINVTDTNVEVEQFNDPATGKTKYRYTTGMNISGMKEKTIEVDPTLVKPITSPATGYMGKEETIYMATLPSMMTELYNKKTGEALDVFQSKGTLYGGLGENKDATKFGSLYSNVEGGANLHIEFLDDGTPMIYPLYTDTSDKGTLNAAVMVGGFMMGGFGATGKLGSALSNGSLAANTAGAQALGAAAFAGTTGYAVSGDLKTGAIAAVLAGATTYGLKSGIVGETLVDLGVPEEWLNGNNDLGVEIPINDSHKPQAFANQLKADGYIIETSPNGYQQVFNQNGIPESVFTDKLNQQLLIYPDATLTTFQQDTIDTATGEVVGKGTGITTTKYDGAGNIETTNYNIGSSGGYEQIGNTKVTSFDASTAANVERSQEALNQAVDDGIISAEDASIALQEIEQSGGVFEGLSNNVKDIVKTVGGGLAAAGIDLKSIFGDGIGGGLQKLLGVGIDYVGLEQQEKALTQRGKDIQEEYASLFKPYTVRTGLGVGTITPEEAVSVADVAYQPIRTAQLDTAKGMFEDLPTTRADATAQQLAATRALTEPERQRQQEQLFSRLQQQGTRGLGITTPTVGGQRRINPLAESLFAAQEQARAQEALSAQSFGLTEAGRQQQLGSNLLTGAQSIDQGAMDNLSRARDISATLQQSPEMAGLSARSGYEQLAALSEIERLRGLQSGARGLFNLPTQQGNVDIEQLTKILNLANALKQQPTTATG